MATSVGLSVKLTCFDNSPGCARQRAGVCVCDVRRKVRLTLLSSNDFNRRIFAVRHCNRLIYGGFSISSGPTTPSIRPFIFNRLANILSNLPGGFDNSHLALLCRDLHFQRLSCESQTVRRLNIGLSFPQIPVSGQRHDLGRCMQLRPNDGMQPCADRAPTGPTVNSLPSPCPETNCQSLPQQRAYRIRSTRKSCSSVAVHSARFRACAKHGLR